MRLLSARESLVVQDNQPGGVTLTTTAMRRMLASASLLVLIAGVQLFILSEDTDRFFAWTITPPITAAFLGAAFWSSFALEALAARRPEWARARIAVPTALTFSVLTLLATLLHLNRFHFGGPTLGAQVAAWAWLAVFVVVPPALALALLRQSRVAGVDPPRTAPIPFQLRRVLAFQGALLGVTGLLLFTIPQAIEPLWPWNIVPLTGRAIGAWLIALAVVAFHVLRENDLDRIYPAMVSYAIFGGLQIVVLFRYGPWVRWGQPSTWLYFLLCISIAVTGLIIMRLYKRRAKRG